MLLQDISIFGPFTFIHGLIPLSQSQHGRCYAFTSRARNPYPVKESENAKFMIVISACSIVNRAAQLRGFEAIANENLDQLWIRT